MTSALNYLGYRFVRYLLTLYVMITGIWLLVHLSPGDPATRLVEQTGDPEIREYMLELYGLNEPLHVQYYTFITNAATLDFGTSFFHRQPVTDIIFPRLANTLVLSVPAYVAVFTVAVLLGSYLGWNRGSKAEEAASYLLISVRSLPHFVMGIFLLMIFSQWLGLFPTGGMRPVLETTTPLSEYLFTTTFYYHLAIPFFTILFYSSANPTILMRTNMINERSKDYVNFMYVRGLPERARVRHTAKNSFLPLLTYTATMIQGMFGGVMIIEIVFSWPGIGATLIQAASTNDYPLAIASFFLMAFVVITANFVIDILYSYFDPRIEYGGS